MTDWQIPTFANIVAFLDSYWQELAEQQHPLIAYQPTVTQTFRDHSQAYDFVDDADRQRSAQLVIVLLNQSFTSQVPQYLLDHHIDLTIDETLAVFNRVVDHRGESSSRLHHKVDYYTTLCVVQRLLTHHQDDEHFSTLDPWINRLKLNRAVVEALR